jgi:hypothetical protein
MVSHILQVENVPGACCLLSVIALEDELNTGRHEGKMNVLNPINDFVGTV